MPKATTRSVGRGVPSKKRPKHSPVALARRVGHRCVGTDRVGNGKRKQNLLRGSVGLGRNNMSVRLSSPSCHNSVDISYAKNARRGANTLSYSAGLSEITRRHAALIRKVSTTTWLLRNCKGAVRLRANEYGSLSARARSRARVALCGCACGGAASEATGAVGRSLAGGAHGHGQ